MFASVGSRRRGLISTLIRAFMPDCRRLFLAQFFIACVAVAVSAQISADKISDRKSKQRRAFCSGEHG
ncbi:hypothetical protein BC374_18830 [Ensifer sp. LC13]|nr:hypothetical protein BC374_18830 [Ensifer sp. LC13]OCP11288.1 hypothetical protein BBX50_19035 [Ensifer sp. LC11]OCP14635.1 hypothetical protein BC362_00055 [Ensifer sp. LC14]OCP33254.1 hypothetical protein BC364_17930 [Ensifer sp. LC499]